VARYRLHQLKDGLRAQFRNATPKPGPLELHRRDYTPGQEIEAASPYAAWKWSRDESGAEPIQVGDVLEAESGELLLCRYAGFEEARWRAPAPAPAEAVVEAPQ